MIIKQFESQVLLTPTHIAIAPSVTYHELNTRANHLAHTILYSHPTLPPESPLQVAILLEKGVDMIVAMLAVLKASMAYVPLDITYPQERLSYMLHHSQSQFLITNHKNRALATALLQNQSDKLTPIIIEDIAPTCPDSNPIRQVTDDHRAYILYTSGSTGHPKGVVQTHKHVLYYIRNWTRMFSITSQDKLTFLTAFTHDGAMQDIFAALLNGATLCPFDIKTMVDRQELADFIRDQKITLWHSVPTLYRYFIENLDGSEHYPFLRAIILGGEPLREHDITSFKTHFPGAILANVYGQTESSVSTICLMTAETPFKKVILGQPLDETEILLVDDNDEVVEGLGSGEIVIVSAYLAPEYWQDPEETKRKFTRDPDLGTMYWTGDLGAYLGSGDIEILGRKDFQVKIRGFRVEMGEIETVLLGHPQIQEVVVTAREENTDEKYLCAYFVPAETQKPVPNGNELGDYLLALLPDYMVPTRFIPLTHMPLTGTGKIDRNALPEPEESQPARVFVAPKSATEQKLAQIWADVLARRDGTHEPIGLEDNFFRLGGHSLRAMTVISRVHKEFNVKLELEDIFTYALLKDLAVRITDATANRYYAIEPTEKREFYPLSSAQKRLYILHQVEPQNTGYNLTAVVEIGGALDLERLQASFRNLIRRHDSLRTSFFLENEEPVQRIHETAPFVLEHISHGADKNIHSIIHSFVRPFELTHPPLLRVGVVYLAEHQHLVLLDEHHIITDGTSGGILVKEFVSLYAGYTLPPLHLQYKDYTLWQQNVQQKQALELQREYWLQRFAGPLPVLELPYDFSRPELQRFDGSTVSFSLGENATATLNQWALKEEVTLYMVLLSVFNLLLWKLSGQEDIIVGTPTAGRRHADLEYIIGVFVNTLALRNFPAANKTFLQFLAEVKKNTLDAFENQDFQFEDLVEQVSVERDASRQPLFDTMFMLQNITNQPGAATIPAATLSGLTVKPYPFETGQSMFDLRLEAMEARQNLFFSLEYCTALFKKETAVRLTDYYQRILTAVTENPERLLADISLLSEAEKEAVLVCFNNTAKPYPADKTIHDLFVEQVTRTPDHTVLAGRNRQGEEPSISDSWLTYQALNQWANTLASLLIEKGAGPNTIVGILTDAPHLVVIGMLGILKTGAAYLPIDPDNPTERIRYILADSHTQLVVSTTNQTSNGIQYVAPDEIPNHLALLPHLIHPAPPHQPDSPCYIIYTSGTTGKPKGVLVRHRGVVNFIWARNASCPFRSSEVTLQLFSHGFDGYGACLYSSLFCGARLVNLPWKKAADAATIIDVIKDYCVTNTCISPSMYGAVLEAAVPGDLDRFSFIVLVGEKSNPELIRKSREKAPFTRLINEYGPTEASVGATAYLNMDETTTAIIGSPIANMFIYLLDHTQQPVPVNMPGEICIGGVGVATGYLNNPPQTIDKFVILPNGRRVYKTGDLAMWRGDGTLLFLGRIGRQVKIRGYRIEPDEIQSLLLTHKSLKDAVVIVRSTTPAATDNRLLAYVVPAEPGETQVLVTTLKEFLTQQLPQYMIPDTITPLDKIPLTPNGKMDTRALPEPMVSGGTDDFTPPHTLLEDQLATLWAGVLGIDKTKIGRRTNFFQLGGHSLKATILLARIHKEMGVRVPLAQVFRNPYIESIALFIQSLEKETFTIIPRAIEKEYYPLSSAQERLFILHQMDKESIGYNILSGVVLIGQPETEKLTAVFKHLIQRHDSFRTSFVMQDGQPSQRILRDVPFEIQQVNSVASFVAPFDLTSPPLLRVGLMEINHQQQVLLVDMHHIISDGVSSTILVQEFIALYAGQQLPPLLLQYKDYSEWQNSPGQQQEIARQKEFWLRLFSGELPVLELPTDFPRPPIQSYEGDGFRFIVDELQTAALKTLAATQRVTLYMILLAAINVLFWRLSGLEDIVIGTPTAGRSHVDLEKIIGMFVNTLALPNFPAGEKQFHQFLAEVGTDTLQAFENQDYPFEDLVNQVSPVRDTARHPLFNTMLTLQNFAQQNPEPPQPSQSQATVKPFSYEKKTTLFDMDITAVERTDTLLIQVSYCTKLFKEHSIQRFFGYFNRILAAVSHTPTILLADIDILSTEEKERILYTFNQTDCDYPATLTIHECFAQQVERTPDGIAVVGLQPWTRDEMAITYQELHNQAEALACRLQSKGVGPDRIVAVKMNPTPEMVVALMGILIAGGAYLPIDMECPPHRFHYMLKDSSARILLTFSPTHTYQLEDVSSLASPAPIIPITPTTSSANLAYIIYTSGSTGKPKGVMIEHRNALNTLFWFGKLYRLAPGKHLLQMSHYTFDASVEDIFASLLFGAVLYTGGRERVYQPELFRLFLETRQIHVFDFVPAGLQELLTGAGVPRVTALKTVIAGGERLPDSLKDRLLHLGYQLYNNYGPTEVAVVGLAIECDAGPVTVGKPITNTKCFIFGKHGELVPIGVAGEICLSGPGLARGYLNNPQLTHEKFITRNAPDSSVANVSPTLTPFRYYRSGDLARQWPDGQIEYLGRLDRQVKIRGFRIELGEIENRLLTHPRVLEAAVMARPKRGGDTHENYLFAYIVPTTRNDQSDSSQPVENSQSGLILSLKEHLAHTLPAYMIPSFFVILTRIPLTANGKIDLRVLPEPEVGDGTAAYLSPTAPIEVHLERLVAQILGIPGKKMGRQTNFFELGAASLDMIRLAAALYKEFAVEIPVVRLFQNPTLQDIAQVIVEKNFQQNQEAVYTVFNPGQERTLFAFPPGIGYGFVYGGLAEYLPEYTVVAFNFIESQDRLKQFAQAIISLQPTRPAILLGYSAAGDLAIEVAHHVEEQGRPVSDILLLDCYRVDTGKRNQDITAFITEVENSLVVLGMEYLKEKVRRKVEAYANYLQQVNHLAAVNATIHSIHAEDRQAREIRLLETLGPDALLSWEPLGRIGFRTFEGHGGHGAMLDNTNLPPNAALIRQILETQRLTETCALVKPFYARLSPVALQFLEYVEKNPAALDVSQFRNLERVNDGLIHLNPWPTFVSRQFCQEMEEAALQVFQLFKSLPHCFFKNHTLEMSHYFELSPQMLETQLKCTEQRHLNALIARGDFVWTQSGFKCLEFNIATEIGGMQLEIWEQLYQETPVLAQFLQAQEVKINTHDLIAILFQHLITAAGETPEEGFLLEHLNIAIVTPDYLKASPDLVAYLTSRFQRELDVMVPHCKGTLSYCDYSHVEVREGKVYVNNQRAKILLEFYRGVVPPHLLEIVEAGHLCLVNGPIGGLLSNKFSMSLLSENGATRHFSLGEQEMIKKYIPWTRKVIPGPTTIPSGETVEMAEYLYANREVLVLKPAGGYGGSGVHIGNRVSPEQWRNYVSTSIKERKWLVQEYLAPLPLLFQSGASGCCVHDSVWGFFVFGNRYGGGYLRVMPRGNDSGVINSAQGAAVSTIIEVEEKKE